MTAKYTASNTIFSLVNLTSVFVGWIFASTCAGSVFTHSTQDGNFPTIIVLRNASSRAAQHSGLFTFLPFTKKCCMERFARVNSGEDTNPVTAVFW